MRKLLFIILIVVLSSCNSDRNVNDNGIHDSEASGFMQTYKLPTGATNIKVIDEHWCYFSLDGRMYLMTTDYEQRGLTEISE